jgi:predicted metal-binding protein
VLLVTEITGSKSGQTHRFLEVGWFITSIDEIQHNKARFETFCNRGCSNFGNNGGCPPYAPNFERLKKIYRNAVVFWVRMPIWEFPVDLLDKADKNFYFCAQYAQAVLPPVIGHVRKEGKKIWNPDFVLGESACKKCNPCAFNDKKSGENEKLTPVDSRLYILSLG